MALKHLNSHKPCAILTKSNGIQLCEIAIVPLLDLEISKEILPFATKLQIDEQGTLQTPYYIECLQYGIGSDLAERAFERWYSSLNLRDNKRITPISYNWPVHYFNIHKWLGIVDNMPYMNDFFCPIFRDLMPTAVFWNDIADKNNEHLPFPSYGLTTIANKLGVSLPLSRTLLDRTYLVAMVYDKITSLHLPTGVDLPLKYPSPVEYLDTPEQEQFDVEDE